MDLNQVYNRIDGYRDEMVSSLSRLISIPSVAVPTKGRNPFGDDVQKAYEAMMEMATEEGFITCDLDRFGGHFDYPGTGDGLMAILGHLDVVPAGDGWDMEAFGGEVVDGFICGRGAIDDKGPVVACFYAMKALKECGYAPDKTIRMILGLDEETEWKGMSHYVAFADRLPDCGFAPDADFPVIHGEKGILVFDIARKFGRTTGEGLYLKTITGGSAANCVADRARAVISETTGKGYDDIRTLIEEIAESRQWKLKTKGVGKSLEIVAEGFSAHGSKPEKGVNAISILMEVLGHFNFVNDDVSEFIRFYNEHIGFDLHGERIGCDISDEASGRLIWNTGMIDLDQKSAKLTINIRYPVTADAEDIYACIMPVIDPFDLGIVKDVHKPPIYIPADDPIIEKLVEVYRKHTGDTKSEPLVIGGGTYARAMDNIVAFGSRFPGGEDLTHQPNEKISIDDLMRLAHIYAEAIYELSKADENAKPADVNAAEVADES